jgi:hypothetical protein
MALASCVLLGVTDATLSGDFSHFEKNTNSAFLFIFLDLCIPTTHITITHSAKVMLLICTEYCTICAAGSAPLSEFRLKPRSNSRARKSTLSAGYRIKVALLIHDLKRYANSITINPVLDDFQEHEVMTFR